MDASLRFLAARILLSTLVAGCGAQTPLAPARMPVPTVTLGLPTDRPLRFGALQHLPLTVRNVTPEAVLLDSVILDGQLPVFEVGRVSAPGALREDRARKQFLYQPRAPGETAPVFTEGWLLLPGEAISVEALVRLRHFVQKIQLRYRPIPMHQCLAEVYFARPDGRRPGQYRFERLTQTELQPYYRAERGTPERLVIVPDETFWPLMATDSSVRVDIRDFAAPGELVAAIGASVHSSVTRWLSAGGASEAREESPAPDRPETDPARGFWIVDDPDAARTFAVRVGENGPVETFDLPRCELTAFDVLDLAANESAIPVYELGNAEPVRILMPRDSFEFMNALAEENRTLRAAWTARADAFFHYGLLAESPPAEAGITDPRSGPPRAVRPGGSPRDG